MSESEENGAETTQAPAVGPPANREPVQVRKGPALIVLGISLLILIGGGLMAVLPGGASSSTGNSGVNTGAGAAGESGVSPSGGTVAAVPVLSASTALSKIQSQGALPRDIVDALVVPANAKVTGTDDLDQGDGQFDRQVNLNAPYTKSSLIECYKTELPLLGWTINSTSTVTTSGATGTEILAQHTSNDGYYWEVGVTITSNDPSISPALSGASSTTTTSSTVEMRVLEVPDGD